MKRAVLIALLLSLVPVLSRAAELKGFGPVTFGMNKDEAWAAIDGEKKWAEADVLAYQLPFDEYADVAKLRVRQSFVNGRAAAASISYLRGELLVERCWSKSLRFAGQIEQKHGIAADIRYGTPENEDDEEGYSESVEDIFVFEFDRGASIRMRTVYNFLSMLCAIRFEYTATSYDPTGLRMRLP